jgi:hypothetical protein
MHTLRTILIASTLALLLISIFPNAAAAQAEPGDVGVFQDAAGTITAWHQPVAVPFDFYTVAFDLGDYQGFELALIVPPELILLNGVALDAPDIICVGLDNCGPQNWMIGLSQCVDASGVHPLTLQSALILSPWPNMQICVGPAWYSSFSPPVPGYLTCTWDLIPFGVALNGQGFYDDGCAVLNPTEPHPIATEETSWGSVKSRFGN